MNEPLVSALPLVAPGVDVPIIMSAARAAAIAALISAGDVHSVQHALFMVAARLIKLPA